MEIYRGKRQIAILLLIALSVLSTISYALAPELRLFTTRLNWFDGNDSDSPRNHNRTLLVVWEGGTPESPGLQFDVYFNRTVGNTFNFTIANNCGFGASTANCTCWSTNFTDHTGPRANCTIQGNVSVPFGVTWNGTSGPLLAEESTLFVVSANATNGTQNTFTAANLSWLRIPESKVFHTLVEFGRGRGNYFFDTSGRETPDGDSGEPYLPNGTRMELNFLHKAYSVRNYYNLPVEKAENATWRCLYGNGSMVRSHLITSVLRSAGIFNATFRIPEIEGSFERQGYIGQQYEVTQAVLGQSFIVNCSSFSYILPNASGNISVDFDDFNLSFRQAESVNFTASTGTSSVGSGTQEVIINYTIHNKEIFPVTDVQVEIGAPLHSQFISVRGELFGVGLKKYVFVTSQLPARGNESIELVARFNTTNADAGLTILNLSGPSRISVVNSWDRNAYNPSKTVYEFQDRHTVTVDMATTVRSESLTDLLQLTRNLTNITLRMNETLISINTSLRDMLQGVNASLQLINRTLFQRVQDINATMHTLNESLFGFLQEINSTLALRIARFNETVIAINTSLRDAFQGFNLSIQLINFTLFDRLQTMNVTMLALNTSLFGFLQLMNTTLVDRIARSNETLVSINYTLSDRLIGVNFSLHAINLSVMGRLSELNLSLQQINVTLVDRIARSNETLVSINYTLSDRLIGVNFSLHAINLSVMGRLSELNLSLQEINATLINRLARINETLISINTSLFDFLVAFNRSAWGALQNLTNITQDTNATITRIHPNISRINVRLDRIEEFENEIVFLVTDSFGMQQKAVREVGEGKIAEAVDSMRRVNSDLLRLGARIEEERVIAVTQPLAKTSSSPVAFVPAALSRDWNIGLPNLVAYAAVFLILAMVIHHFHITRKKDDDNF